jgi:hypothetical protein
LEPRARGGQRDVELGQLAREVGIELHCHVAERLRIVAAARWDAPRRHLEPRQRPPVADQLQFAERRVDSVPEGCVGGRLEKLHARIVAGRAPSVWRKSDMSENRQTRIRRPATIGP